MSSYLPIPAGQSVIEVTPDSSNLDLGKLLRRYLALAILLTLFGAGAGFLSVGLIAPAYKARALVEVQPISNGILKMPDLADFGQVDLLTESEILKSNSFLVKVLERLQLEPMTEQPVQTDVFSRLRHWFKVDTSDSILESVNMAGLSVGNQPKAIAMALRTLEVRPIERTHILEITCDSTRPQFSVDFLTVLTDEYTQQNYLARMESVQSTTQWISGQLAEAKGKLIEAEQRLQEFVRNSGSSYAMQDNVQAKLRDLQARLSGAQADLLTKQALYEIIQKSKPEMLPTLLNDPTLRQFQARIADLEREEATLKTTLLSEHPKVKRVDAQIAELQSRLQKEVESVVKRISDEYEAARRDEELLKQSYLAAAGQVNSQAGKEAEYNALKKESDLAREAYNNLLLQNNQASTAGSIPVNNIRIVDRPVPAQKPYKPKPVTNITMGGVAGLGLCFAFAFLREKLDGRVSSPAHARKLFNLPELGVIPSVKKGGAKGRLLAVTGNSYSVHEEATASLVVGEGKNDALNPLNQSMLAESFRVTLAALLRERKGRRRPQIIVTTSAGPAEGKTTIVSNLGIALAETGQRVLVFDADFRRPRLHVAFDVPNTCGITNLLDGSTPIDEYAINQLGVRTSIHNLFVLPNGPQATNISKALYSPRLRGLFERLRLEFDTVLVDAPPMFPVADARIVAAMADGVVLVLRSGVSSKDSVEEALEKLRADGATILGTILNDWRLSKTQMKNSYYYGVDKV